MSRTAFSYVKYQVAGGKGYTAGIRSRLHQQPSRLLAGDRLHTGLTQKRSIHFRQIRDGGDLTAFQRDGILADGIGHQPGSTGLDLDLGLPGLWVDQSFQAN